METRAAPPAGEVLFFVVVAVGVGIKPCVVSLVRLCLEPNVLADCASTKVNPAAGMGAGCREHAFHGNAGTEKMELQLPVSLRQAGRFSMAEVELLQATGVLDRLEEESGSAGYINVNIDITSDYI